MIVPEVFIGQLPVMNDMFGISENRSIKLLQDKGGTILDIKPKGAVDITRTMRLNMALAWFKAPGTALLAENV